MKQPGGTPWGLTYGFVLIWGLSVSGWTTASANTSVPAQPASTPFLTTPLSFEANVGQVEAPVHYLARTPGYGVFLTPTEAVLVMQRPTTPPESPAVPAAPRPAPLTEATLRLQFLGTKGDTAAPTGRKPLSRPESLFPGQRPYRMAPPRAPLRPGGLRRPLSGHRPGLLRASGPVRIRPGGRPRGQPACH